MFRYVNTVTGETIATGPLSLLNDQLAAQRTAEGAIRAAALAADTRIRVRADALAEERKEFEAERDAWERKVQSDKIKAFVDAVAAIASRFDALEQARQDAELKRLPDPDACADFLPQATIPPSADRHREQERELAQVEEAIEKDDALELHHEDQGDLPSSLLAKAPSQPGNYLNIKHERNERQVPQPIAVSLNSAPSRSDFTCRRDFKAWRRQQRRAYSIFH
jgi:hypothetical protein